MSIALPSPAQHPSTDRRDPGATSEPPRPAAKRDDIQGLRAIAVVLVVIYHAHLPLSGGFVGVDVFFVISGFVITGQLQRMQAASAFSFASFYARRIRRLLPAMTVVLLTVLVLSFLLESPLGAQAKTAQTAKAAALLNGNFHILNTSGGYFAGTSAMNPLLHVWSLGVEEQFYLVFPAVFLLAWKLGRWRLVALGGLTGASLALSLWCSYADLTINGRPALDFAFYSSPTRAWEFGVGAMLAVWVETRSRSRGATVLGLAGLVLLLVTVLTVDSATTWPGAAALMPVTAAGLLLLSGRLGTGPVQRLLGSGPLRVIGDLSYSIYLWHWPIIVMATLVWPHNGVAVAAAAFSLVPAYLSYRFVEQPMREKRFSLPAVYIGATAAVLAVAAAAAVLTTVGPKAVPDVPTYAKQQIEPTYGRANGCFLARRPFTTSDIASCTVTVPHAKGWIMLAGDSHAESLSTGLIAADTALGYSTQAVTGASCQFSRTAHPNVRVSNCAELASTLLDQVHSPNPPSAVVIGQWALPQYTIDPDWPTGLKPALTEISDAGIPVIYAQDIPNFALAEMNRLAACSGGFLHFQCEKPEQELLSYQNATRLAEADVARSVPGVTILDPWLRFCGDGTCSPLVNGQLAYTDFGHLNRIGSAALTGDLQDAVSRALDQRWPGRA